MIKGKHSKIRYLVKLYGKISQEPNNKWGLTQPAVGIQKEKQNVIYAFYLELLKQQRDRQNIPFHTKY